MKGQPHPMLQTLHASWALLSYQQHGARTSCINPHLRFLYHIWGEPIENTLVVNAKHGESIISIQGCLTHIANKNFQIYAANLVSTEEALNRFNPVDWRLLHTTATYPKDTAKNT